MDKKRERLMGLLWKQPKGIGRGWGERKFVLEENGELHYQSRRGRKRKLKYTKTKGITSPEAPTPYVIELEPGGFRVAAKDEADYKVWTEALNHDIDEESVHPVTPSKPFSPTFEESVSIKKPVAVAKEDFFFFQRPLVILAYAFFFFAWYLNSWLLAAVVLIAMSSLLGNSTPNLIVHDDSLMLQEPQIAAASSIVKGSTVDTKSNRISIRKTLQGHVLVEVPFGKTPRQMTWSVAPSSSLHVRQKGYLMSRQKAPSLESLYECVYANVFNVDANVNEIAQVDPYIQKLISDENMEDTHIIPPYIIVNAQVPSIVGPLRRGDTPADGPGYHIVFAAKMREETRSELMHIDDTDAQNPRRAAIRVLRDYCQDALADQAEKGRFKVICSARNLERVPKLARRYNGKPALINKMGHLVHRKGKYLEMDVNIHAFGYVARSGLNLILNNFSDFVCTTGFVLEARAEAELPETLLFAADLNHLS